MDTTVAASADLAFREVKDHSGLPQGDSRLRAPIPLLTHAIEDACLGNHRTRTPSNRWNLGGTLATLFWTFTTTSTAANRTETTNARNFGSTSVATVLEEPLPPSFWPKWSNATRLFWISFLVSTRMYKDQRKCVHSLDSPLHLARPGYLFFFVVCCSGALIGLVVQD